MESKHTRPDEQLSISEQIIENLLTRLGADKEFDSNLLDKIRRLASQGNLSKAAQVNKAIKSSGETGHAST